MPFAAFAPRPRLPGSETPATRSVCSQILASGGGWITWASLPSFIAATAPRLCQRARETMATTMTSGSLRRWGSKVLRAPKPCW